jgi:hypothetical protein
MDVRVLERNFSEPLSVPAVRYTPKWYSWRAIGGPYAAEVGVSGTPEALWEMIEKLRCPVEIVDEQGEACWWGFVNAVQIGIGPWSIGVSLETMFNRVAMAYSLVNPGSQTVGTRATTSWVQNDDSIATYGQKEFRGSLAGATTTQANAARDALLAQARYPIPDIRPRANSGELMATLECLGWWETLGWRYYANTNTSSVETTTQIAAMITAAGPFFLSTSIMSNSGITSSEYRDGESLAIEAIEKLLKGGTTNGRRLLATVTRERMVRVYEEPTAGANDYLLNSQGDLSDSWELSIPRQRCTVGVWARLKDVIPATADVSKLADPSRIFIEAAEFNADKLTYSPEPRGVPGVWELGQRYAEVG